MAMLLAEIPMSVLGIQVSIGLGLIGGIASILKWVVNDKLTSIFNAIDEIRRDLKSQTEKLTRIEIEQARLMARVDAIDKLLVEDDRK